MSGCPQRAALLLLCLAAAALLPTGLTPAFARRDDKATPPVLIIAHGLPVELVRRVVSELEYLGFLTVLVWRPADAAGRAVVLDAAGLPYRHVLVLDGSGLQATLLVRTADGRAPPRRQALALHAGEDIASTAMRLAEWVRVARVDLAPPQVTARVVPVAQLGHTLRLAVGPAWSPGGAGPSGQLWLAGDWGFAPWLALAGTALVPVWGARLRNAFGQAALYPSILGLGARLRPWPAARRLRLSGVLGAGLSVLHLRGSTPFAVLRGVNDWLIGGVGYCGVDLALRVWPRAWVVLGALTGVVLPRPVVTFAGLDAGRWGRPLLALSVGLELSP